MINDPEIGPSLSDEARETALMFWRDFEKSGIHLPPEQRTRFVELSSKIFELGRDFVNNSSAPRPPVALPATPLRELGGAGLFRRFKPAANAINIQPGSNEARMVMATVPDDATRRALYVATHSSSRTEVDILETMLKTRASLASLVGKPSYAHMTLDDKMTKTPDNVMSFLLTQLGHSRPRALQDVQAIAKRKQSFLRASSLPTAFPWDRDIFAPHVPSTALRAPMPPLTPGTVFFGLSRLFTHLFGISFRPAAMQPGEAWHEDVRKLEVVDEREGLVGWIYADLFSRPGKAAGAAHYTVRCSRRVDDDDADGDFDLASGAEPVDDWRLLNVPAHSVRGKSGLYQLPIVVLLCDFPSPTRDRGASTLDWGDVSTIVHEMGHAVHCELWAFSLN